MRYYFLLIFLPLLTSATTFCDKNKNVEAVKDDCNKTKIVGKVEAHQLFCCKKLQWKDNSVSSDNTTCSPTNNQDPAKNIPRKMRIIGPFVYLFLQRILNETYSSLNFFKLSDVVYNDEVGFAKCPELDCYPNCPDVQFFKENIIVTEITCSPQTPTIVNAVEIFCDRFNRCWVLDTGYVFNPTSNNFEMIQNSQICPFDADNPDVQGTCLILSDEFSSPTYTTMIVNDNSDDKHNTYFYVIDPKKNIIVVCSLATGICYAFRAPQFLPNPLNAFFDVLLPNYQKYAFIVTDGINRAIKGERGVFLIGGARTELLHIPFTVLNNETLSKCELNYKIKTLGTFNDKGQSTDFVSDGDIFYFTQIQNNAVACVNVKNGVNPDGFQLISIDKAFSSLQSIQIHQDNTDCKKIILFVNNIFDIEQNGYNENKDNFCFFYIESKDVETYYPNCIAHVSQLYDHFPTQQIYPFEKNDRYELAAASLNEYSNAKKIEKMYPPVMPVFFRQSYNVDNFGSQSMNQPPCGNAEKLSYGL